MTNFINGLEPKQEEKEVKKTVFKKFLTSYFIVRKPSIKPKSWGNVKLIGRDNMYGDVFIAWEDDPNDFGIYFGTAGDEFNL